MSQQTTSTEENFDSVSNPSRQDKIMIPMDYQLTSFVKLRGVGLYMTENDTSNCTAIFLPPKKSLPSTTFKSGFYDYSMNVVDRLFLFMGYDLWDHSQIKSLDVIDFYSIHKLQENTEKKEKDAEDQESDSEDDFEDVVDTYPAVDNSSIMIHEPLLDQVEVNIEQLHQKFNSDAYHNAVKPRSVNGITLIEEQNVKGKIFHSTCFDNDNNCAYIYGGFASGRIMSNEIVKLSFISNNSEEQLTAKVIASMGLVSPTEAKDAIGSVPNREGHTAVWRNGKMYVLGGNAGRPGTFEREILEFDFKNNTITPIATNGVVFPPRAYHSSIYLSKYDAMVVFGGKLKPGKPAGLSSQCHIFHFKTNTWELLSDIVFPIGCLSGHAVLALNDHVFAIIGGTKAAYGDDKDQDTKIYVFDMESRQFASYNLASYGYRGRYSMPCAFSKAGNVIAIGGGFNNLSCQALTLIYLEPGRSAFGAFSGRMRPDAAFKDITIKTQIDQ